MHKRSRPKANREVRRRWEIDEAVRALAIVVYNQFMANPAAVKARGEPPMLRLHGDPSVKRLHPRPAIVWFVAQAGWWPLIDASLFEMGVRSFDEGLKPLMDRLSTDKLFMEALAEVYDARLVGKPELVDSLYAWLEVHGRQFLLEVCSQTDREDLFENPRRIPRHVLRKWHLTDASLKLPRTELTDEDVTEALKDWMIYASRVVKH